MNNKGLLAGLIAIVVVVTGYIVMSLHYQTKEVELRNEIEAQQVAVGLSYDATWKIIAQKAQVSDDYKHTFAEIYPALMEGRYGDERGGALMSWISEHNPEFDTTLYKSLQDSIEAERKNFEREQKRLVDLKAQHDNLRESPISGHFVGDADEIEIQTVTSSKTEEVMESGREDNIDVFGQ